MEHEHDADDREEAGGVCVGGIVVIALNGEHQYGNYVHAHKAVEYLFNDTAAVVDYQEENGDDKGQAHHCKNIEAAVSESVAVDIEAEFKTCSDDIDNSSGDQCVDGNEKVFPVHLSRHP